VHSGDSACSIPSRTISKEHLEQIRDYTAKIAKALKVVGLINVQYAICDGKVYILEANPRASRTVPFIAKAYDEPYVNYATKVMLGHNKVTDFNFQPRKEGYAIKIPVFSYEKFPDVKKELGPEMKSTGEAIRFIKDLKDPFFTKIYAERNMHLSR
jgi:carbamoyl-phosphate synthase large subunit